VRILDFSWAWAGPFATQLAAFLGAEVIRVEGRTRMDMFRPPHAPELVMGFQEVNQGKRSVRLNLSSAEGRALALRLATLSDAVVENFRPGVMDRLGLGHDTLAAVRPDLIYLSVSAHGQDGPEAGYGGYAPTFAAQSGLVHLTGYPDFEPHVLRAPSDLVVASAAGFALVAALVARRRGAPGDAAGAARIDLSSVEALAVTTGEALTDYAATGLVPTRRGNEDRETYPHDCYPCAPVPPAGAGPGEPGRTGVPAGRGVGPGVPPVRAGPGDPVAPASAPVGAGPGTPSDLNDNWLSIAAGDPAEWRALAHAIGRPDLAGPDLDDVEARRARAAEIDAAIAAWTRPRDKWEATRLLQAAGVPAFPSVSPPDCFADPHLAARAWTREIDHPVLGRLTTLAPPWRFRHAPLAPPLPAPTFGQHTETVLGDLLGLPPAELARLESEKVLY
jgi:crotonobetainyl-CoA:carnitine CoA-transferase CaiB-like acyl-CoA transferase